MPDLQLVVHQTEQTPKVIEDNFDRIRQYTDNLLMGRFEGAHVEYVIEGAVTNLRLPHGLNFQPKDIIETSRTGAGSLTWNYALFDREEIDITTTGAVTVRAFIGVYDNEREGR